MIDETMLPHIAAAVTGLVRATVIRVNDDGSVLVAGPDAPHASFACDRLITGLDLAPLAADDTVLCSLPSSSSARGVVLGRVGASHAPDEPSADEGPPDSLLIEATRELTLRVGDGSITIRADGKVLIKGTDLVSHARRMNRIKGGGVSIN